ncbi:MAG: YbhB/YbcL family Raf kinase inhibitor-like protein [Bacteroidota bacterium]|nr:YbhB/YbcL family Raf kinase inhibitor-like protein [Bacteroidota bacterium]MDP4232857.1 YbhB/YbcL family Raf kinase inhibitor-like protein [Bacteroidota bacterium]MDP4241901.1 YbhB/YbcL family Raf kinase inhibitor-like protein [Bacteroidota bacterium]MDP4288226.1 YbhB/YbcL family Raf kinase inhibitor-like protein [Bacteroidota bacterium]
MILKSTLFLILILSGACKMNSQQRSYADTSATMVMAQTMTMTSNAFKNDESIPQRYSCQGDNLSPALSWGNTPNGTNSYALVCEDPDAPHGTFIHWVVYNIPAGEHGLGENIPKKNVLPNGTRQGKNGAGQTGYSGPCPPAGKAHRYYFRLYALDSHINIAGDVTRDKLMSAIEGHVLGEGEIMGTYQRQ